jgi:nucleotide-binding universal stress UspA family protein
MFTNILVPTDGGPLSRKATMAAIKLAKQQNGRIVGVHATPAFVPVVYDGMVPPPELVSPTEHGKAMARFAAKVLGGVEKMCREGGIPFEGVHVPDEEPYRAVIKVARRKHCDLVLMASHGRRGFTGLLLGSETQKVLTHSKLPVIVVR